MKGMLGGILIAVGILVMGASGLCTVVFLASVTGSTSSSDPSMLAFWAVVSAVVGGTPFVGGIGMILAGRHVMRSARAEDDQA